MCFHQQRWVVTSYSYLSNFLVKSIILGGVLLQCPSYFYLSNYEVIATLD